MSRIATLSGRFPNGVLLVTDADSPEQIPTWSAELPQLAIGRTVLAVTVLHEIDGTAEVVLSTGAGDGELAATFDGDISIPSGTLVVSDVEGEQRVEHKVSPGDHRVRICLEPVDYASNIQIILDPTN